MNAHDTSLTHLLLQVPQRELYAARNRALAVLPVTGALPRKHLGGTPEQVAAAVHADTWRRARRTAFKGIVPLAEAARLHPATREALR